MRALIIDDSVMLQEILKDMLAEGHSDVEVLGCASNGHEGLAMIRKHDPDLVFLDVEMPDMTGFEMLMSLEEFSFRTIFVTSHSHYAIKAIRFNALDYLLKPIDPAELASSIKRFRTNHENKMHTASIRTALNNLTQTDPKNLILLLNTQDQISHIPLGEILYLEAQSNYSYIHLVNRSKKLSSRTLAHFEQRLADKGFYRTHRSFLVNGSHIESLKDNNTFVLSNEKAIPISRRRKVNAKHWYASLNSPS